jgi:hypothetical protein
MVCLPVCDSVQVTVYDNMYTKGTTFSCNSRIIAFSHTKIEISKHRGGGGREGESGSDTMCKSDLKIVLANIELMEPNTHQYLAYYGTQKQALSDLICTSTRD